MSGAGWVVVCCAWAYASWHAGYNKGMVRGFAMVADLIREELAKDRGARQ